MYDYDFEKFDAILHVAYAEIYAQVLDMEKQEKIDTDLDTESLCFECWKLAQEFVKMWENMCKYAPTVDYYGSLDTFIYEKAMEKWKPMKRYDVLIDANVTMTYPVLARNRDDAQRRAENFMKTPAFDRSFRDNIRIAETEIGDVIEP